MKRALLWLILSFGLGSFLTLLSCFYKSQPRMLFLDEVPSAYKSVQVGYPFPVFSYYAELWSSGQFCSDAVFVWMGALFDTIFYAVIVFGVLLIVPVMVMTVKGRKPRFTE